MKSNRILILALTGALPFFSATCLRADDWKTTDGKVYQDVKVVSVSPDTVTILHQDGGASVPLAKLTPDLQKRFFYDPAKAQAATEEKAKKAAARLQAMRDHEREAEQLLAMNEDGNASQTPPDSSTPTGPLAASSPHSGQTSSQDFADTLTDIPLTAPASPTHHTVDDAAASAQSMRRDLSDPTYHTMAHMQYMIRVQGLRPDPNDPKHHTMDEIGH